jgi:hypothetical protein
MSSVHIEIANCATQSTGVQTLKWAVQMLSGLFIFMSFLLTYRHSVNVRAGDLLLKLEEAFKTLGMKLGFLEFPKTCYDPIKGILVKFMQDPDYLDQDERSTLADIDTCIRFLYLCTLHTGDTIPTAEGKDWRRFFYGTRVPQAFYYYLNKLNDQQNRPELYSYIRKYYPTLARWLDKNQRALTSYGA